MRHSMPAPRIGDGAGARAAMRSGSWVGATALPALAIARQAAWRAASARPCPPCPAPCRPLQVEAKCGAQIYVVVVDALTGQLVQQGLDDAFLQVCGGGRRAGGRAGGRLDGRRRGGGAVM